jgi:GDP-D-mannose 3',5'-epimerase
MEDEVVVAAGGGFMGGHVVADELRRGHSRVRSVDRKPLEE